LKEVVTGSNREEISSVKKKKGGEIKGQILPKQTLWPRENPRGRRESQGKIQAMKP